MSIGDYIRISDNQYSTNPNIVHYNNINCNKSFKSRDSICYSNISCQNLPNIVENVNSEFSIQLITNRSEKADNIEFDLNPKRDYVMKSNLEFQCVDEKYSPNQKQLEKEICKPSIVKSSENKTSNSKFDKTMVSETFSARESNGPATKKCKVCFDKAVNQNFGVLSCESCKAFFRRNAIRASPLKCSNGTDLCCVTSSTRKQCPSCRLKKCLQVGMKSELIQIRKNNPKINLGKRTSNAIQQDGSHNKWANHSTTCSNSSGRLSEDNIEDNVKINDNNLVQNISENSPLISASVWINTAKYPVNNQQNLWFPMNLDQQRNDSINCNLLSTGCITPINHQQFTQTSDSVKYDVQIPMIKIKTNHNILQPIAVFPMSSTSIYESPNHVQSIYPNETKPNPPKVSKDLLFCGEILTYSDLPVKNIYQYDFSNYSISDNSSKSSLSSNNSPTGFCPFSMQPVGTTSHSVYFNSVESTNANSYLWEYPHHNSESSINIDQNHNFVPIDSESDAVFCNQTYTQSCNSSHKIYLSPKRLEILESNHCIPNTDGDETTRNEEYKEIFLSDEFQMSENEHFENIKLSKYLLTSSQSHFINEMEKIWKSTLGRVVIVSNLNSGKIFSDLPSSEFDSFKLSINLLSTENWKTKFFQMSNIILSQINLFFDKLIDILDNNNEFLGYSLKSELVRVLKNESNETVLLTLIPVIFSNLIGKNDDLSSDNEHRDLFSQQNINSALQEPSDYSTIYFSIHCPDPSENASNLVNVHINLTSLSGRFLELDNIKYSSLQYLDKYCSGLSNFLSPTTVFYCLFALLKVMTIQSKEDFCDHSWNTALLKRECSPKSVTGILPKLIYDLKSIFVTACDIVQTDTVEQRLHSLDQFLTWSRSQFDIQWIEFFTSIKTEQEQAKYQK